MKTVRYLIEAALLHTVFIIFSLMPTSLASNCGGFIGRTLGPLLGASRKARRNIARAFPDLDPKERETILVGMWDNLGRVVCEYPHLSKLARTRTKIIGQEILDDLKAKNGQAIFIGAHMANWEINCAAALKLADFPVDITYRAPNNPWTGKLLQKARTMNGSLPAHPKSKEGGISLLRALKEGRSAGILIDQKYNQGIAVPFFGHDAMTNPVFVTLAQRIKCPVIPIRCVRKNGCDFELQIFEAIPVFDESGEPLSVESIVMEANTIVEGWIKDHPEQWLWLHRRWTN